MNERRDGAAQASPVAPLLCFVQRDVSEYRGRAGITGRFRRCGGRCGNHRGKMTQELFQGGLQRERLQQKDGSIQNDTHLAVKIWTKLLLHTIASAHNYNRNPILPENWRLQSFFLMGRKISQVISPQILLVHLENICNFHSLLFKEL